MIRPLIHSFEDIVSTIMAAGVATITATGTITADKFRASASKTTADVAYGFVALDGYGILYASGKVMQVVNTNILTEAIGTTFDTNTAVGLVGQGLFKLDGKIAVSLTADQSNWAPSSGDTRAIWQVTPDAARVINSITSMVTQGSGGTVLLKNMATNVLFTITLTHEDTGTATVARRIVCPANLNMVIPANGAALLHYDTSISRIQAYPLF